MNILSIVGAAGGLALLCVGSVMVRAWLRARVESRRFAMDPVRRIRDTVATSHGRRRR